MVFMGRLILIEQLKPLRRILIEIMDSFQMVIQQLV